MSVPYELKVNNILNSLAVLWIVLSSGSMFFGQLNTGLSMMGLLIIGGLFLAEKSFVVVQGNIKRLLGLMLFLILNVVITGIGNNRMNDFIIFVIRILTLCIMQSHIKRETFVDKFVNIICGISVISLVCWGIGVIYTDFPYPFLFEVHTDSSHFYGTFYYTIGMNSGSRFGSSIGRNAGIFWEPGVYQIYLNLAIFFLLSFEKCSVKHKKLKFILLSITLVTTQSSMGYLIYMVLIIGLVFLNNPVLNSMNIKKLLIMALIVVIPLVILEGSLVDKLLHGGGSFNTRYDDFVTTMQVFLERPFLGLGSFSNLLEYVSINYANSRLRVGQTALTCSNGLANIFATHGVFFALYYIYRIFKYGKRTLDLRQKETCLWALVVIMCLCNEPIVIVSFFLAFLFDWKVENEEEQYVENNC